MVMATSVGADRFTEMTVVPEPLRDVVFALTVAGFGSKAGLVPLHAWLARAHPEAPSPVSALMSAAMVTLGVYGIIRFDLVLIGPGPRWWAVLLLLIGAASALYGVLQASVATDVKRLLAYSTTDNMGLITMALGASLILASAGVGEAAAIAAVAALLHLLAHAAFKSLGFMAAGSVLSATGLRDLDRLGGLARPMPITTVLFGVAALGACGLPLGAGFVSEWLLVQALVHAGTGGDVVVALAAPLAVGAVALTTGLSVAAMVKAFGIGFLARPRSAAARQARESAPSMLAAMIVVAVICVVLALAPAAVAAVVTRVVAVIPTGRTATPAVDFAAVIRLPGLGSSIAPGLLAAAFVAALLAAAVAMRWRARRRPPSAELPLWACGAEDLTPRMQYTATSFAEPLQRVFNDVLRPASDVDVTHHSESRYMVSAITYRNRITDALEIRLYHPIVTAVTRAAEVVRRAHNGSVHLYLAYGALGVLVVLVIAR
jgi:formate hydrogenlyase subunit 3/multisubunit Na+/H+ antiporter MnhD subunit